MYFFFNSSMWISNLRSVNLFSTLQKLKFQGDETVVSNRKTNSFKAWNYRLQGRSRPVSTGVINKIAYLPVVNTIQAMKLHLWFLLDLGMHLYHTVFAVRLSLLSFAVTALLPSQCCHHAAVTPLTFHNQTVKLQSVTDDSKFIFFIYWREYKFNL